MDINPDANTNADAVADAISPPTQKPVLYARFPRSFGFEFIMTVFCCPPLIVLWAFVAYYYYLSGVVSFPILRVAVYYSAGFALAVLLYGNNRAVRQGRGVILDGERIVKKDGGGVRMLDYADIRDAGCTVNPLFNKRMIIESTVGSVTLPLNLSGSYKMVETIFEKSAEGGRLPDNDRTVAAKRRLYVTAAQYNALYKMRERYMGSFITIMSASAFFNGFVAALYWERGIAEVLVWGFAGMLFQVLGYFAAERFWVWKRFDRGDTRGISDSDSFKTTCAVAALVALLASMVAGIAVTLPVT